VKHNQPKENQMKFFSRKKKQQPTLHELCDSVAAHPDSLLVFVLDSNDFEDLGLDPASIDPELLQEDLLRVVVEAG
jgi:hypothetical protein